MVVRKMWHNTTTMGIDRGREKSMKLNHESPTF
jgi:hypothetical protein